LYSNCPWFWSQRSATMFDLPMSLVDRWYVWTPNTNELKYSRWCSKRRLWDLVVSDVAKGWLKPTLKCNPSYEARPNKKCIGGSKKRLWELVVSFVWQSQLQQGVCLTMALPFALKSILRQKKNYENSTISPCENIIFKKSLKRNQNPSRNYISIITNLNFQHKPKYHIKIDLLLRRQNLLS
jgi:hypothetical protein